MIGWHHRLNGHELWANSERWWRTGKPGTSVGLQRVRYDWVTEQKHQTYTDHMASAITTIVGFPVILLSFHSFSHGSDSKESACDAGDPDWILGSGRSLGEGSGWLSTPAFWPGEFHGQRRLVCTLDCKELDTTEQLTPLPWWLLQYSCIKYISKIMPKSKYNGDLSVGRGKETWNRKEVERGKTPCNLLKCQCMKLKENYMIVKLEREIHIVDLHKEKVNQ